ncbi:LPXTG cell wall anchor domain-containing protein [Diaminobutyricibacter sp. McL0618]|uniref:LPXTG cell wall anchor domain-containing protein n=1 Tax=Leifsonia sp. McL0618 TaxID=3415677 RepID=UPI003CFAB3F1
MQPERSWLRPVLAAGVGAAAIGALVVAAPAHALEEPATSSSTAEASDPAPDRVTHISVSPLQALPGGQVHVTGECTYKGNPATLVLLSLMSREEDKLRGFDGPIDAVTGLIDADVTIPHDVPPGIHEFHWMCSLSDMAFGADDEKVLFTVLDPGTKSLEPTPTATPPAELTATTEAAATNSTDELADTGSSVAIPAIAGISLGLAGGTAVLVQRRRNRPVKETPETMISDGADGRPGG